RHGRVSNFDGDIRASTECIGGAHFQRHSRRSKKQAWPLLCLRPGGSRSVGGASRGWKLSVLPSVRIQTPESASLCGRSDDFGLRFGIGRWSPAEWFHQQRLRPREWCTSRKSWLGWTRTQLTTADNRAG